MEVSPLKTEMMQLNAELIASKTGIESPSAASLFLAMEAARHTHVRAVRLYPDEKFSLDDRNDEDARGAMASIAARELRITG
jgi:phosphoribosylformylglycinamidine (FGAM) synthase PurS component